MKEHKKSTKLITQKVQPTHKTKNKGSGRQDGERGGRTQTQHLRAGTSRDLWEGEGLGGGGRGIKYMDTARTSRKEVGISKKWICVELTGVEKIKVLDGGR